jgi:hypothetical protein
MSETRKLAAILVADVVGYSRLAADEFWRGSGRFAAISSTLPSPCTTAAPSSGPATAALIEFRSVVDAARWRSKCRTAWSSATPACRLGAASSFAFRPTATSANAVGYARFTSIRDIGSVATTFRLVSKLGAGTTRQRASEGRKTSRGDKVIRRPALSL